MEGGGEGEEEEWEGEELNIYPKSPLPLALLVERNMSPPLQWVASSGEEPGAHHIYQPQLDQCFWCEEDVAALAA